MSEQVPDWKLRQVEEEGRQAQELLSNPLIQRFFVEMKGDLLNEFQLSNLDDEKSRLNAWQKGQLLHAFEKKFNDTIKLGNHAKLTLLERVKHKVRSII